jgi:hypothetical protein
MPALFPQGGELLHLKFQQIRRASNFAHVRSKHEPLRRRPTLHLSSPAKVPRAARCCRKSSGRSNFRFWTNDFDCAGRGIYLRGTAQD